MLSSITEQIPELRPLRGNTYIPAKAGLFSECPFKIFRGPILDNFVAIPTFRKKYGEKSGLAPELVETLHKQATIRWTEFFVNVANNSNNIAICPGSERLVPDKKDQAIRPGIGRIACAIDDPDRF